MLTTPASVSAQVVPGTDRDTLHWFVSRHVTAGATICTDAHTGYKGIPGVKHLVVNHQAGEYATGPASTNAVEPFWSMLKRGIVGTYHHISVKHLQAYVDAFAGGHSLHRLRTAPQMNKVAAGMVRKHLRYTDLTARLENEAERRP
ncbi:MAG: IS1595 family transposase [Actinomycetia bacterium]|nr:IS1595 family transposase [Actinomycetes bacterium]